MMRFVAGFFVAWLFLVGVTFWTDHRARVELVTSQREGCERAIKDRTANAQGWRHAQQARNASGDHEVARQYARIAAGLEERARTNCKRAFPSPPLLNFR